MPKTGTLLDPAERQSFTAWLAESVERAGLTPRELGHYLGYDSENDLKPAQRYLVAGSIPTAAVASALADALGVPGLEVLVRAGHLDAILPAIEHLVELDSPWARKLAFDSIFALFPPADVFGKPLFPLHDGLRQAKGAVMEAAGHLTRAPSVNADDDLSAFRFLDFLIARWARKHRTLRNPHVRRAQQALRDGVLSPDRRRAVAASYLHDWAARTDPQETEKRLGAAALASILTSRNKREGDTQ